jgi:hypothetical protein
MECADICEGLLPATSLLFNKGCRSSAIVEAVVHLTMFMESRHFWDSDGFIVRALLFTSSFENDHAMRRF